MLRLLSSHLKHHTINKRRFHRDNRLLRPFHQPRSGYPSVYDGPSEIDNLSTIEKVKKGCQLFKEECRLFAKEVRSLFQLYPSLPLPDEENVVWKFDGTEKSLKQWIVTCDSDYQEGYSTAKLELSTHGTGIFHGTLNTFVPKDGRTTHAGYCNMTTVPKYKSFKRKDYYNWVNYNQLILKVRGDGRCYMVNILQKGYHDLTWNNAYHYVMYTRGGPYWQHVKIPFSKFVYSVKGTVQDRQHEMPETTITNLGITLADKKSGPFRLEIDYIAVCYDTCNFESNAYEMYDMSKPVE